MRFFRISLLISCCAVFAVIGISCSGNTRVAGWGSETTNGLTAAVCKSDGSPAAWAQVRLRTSDYVTQPPASLTKSIIDKADALTDEQGRFIIRDIAPGSYSIEVSDSSTGSGQGGAVLFACTLATGDTVNFGTDTLRPFGVAIGSADTSGTDGKPLYVQVLGLERLVPVDSAGTFKIKDLPEGHFNLRIIAAEGAQTTVVRSDSVSVATGDTVNATMSGWKFSKRIYLNTTASGANVPGNVYGFPVCVRLTNSNFAFDQAMANGGDVRFTKMNGLPLPYEIERWDAALQQAEIWVKVDTVHGNNSTQSITMYWGASTVGSTGSPQGSATVSLSNGAAVFDTGNGFQGVWHLGQSGTPALDATPNHYDGTLSDTAPTAAAGAIGNCQEFNGTSNCIRMRGTANSTLDFPEHGTYAVSAWVYADTLDSTYQKIIEKNNFQYKLQIDCFDAWSFGEYESLIGHELTNAPATAKTWVFLTGIRSGTKQYLYINDVCVMSTISTLAFSGPRDTTSDCAIGGGATYFNGSWSFFKGKIDEARIENTARSANWIKLCFMNQKAQDALVVYK